MCFVQRIIFKVLQPCGEFNAAPLGCLVTLGGGQNNYSAALLQFAICNMQQIRRQLKTMQTPRIALPIKIVNILWKVKPQNTTQQPGTKTSAQAS